MENRDPLKDLAKLREPFKPHQVSKLPKPTCSMDEWKKLDKGKCQECGGWHAKTKTMHLDYVGHAALTDRLLDVDPLWTWEPVAYGPDGLPAFDKAGGLWIRLTVCGHTRLGYGNAGSGPNKGDGNREKEVIGDALRNAAMRFGAALDLWHKGDLHDDDGEPQPRQRAAAPSSRKAEPPRGKAEPISSGGPEPYAVVEEALEDIAQAPSELFLQVVANRLRVSGFQGVDVEAARKAFADRRAALQEG